MTEYFDSLKQNSLMHSRAQGYFVCVATFKQSQRNNKVTPSLHLRCGDNHFVVPCAFSERGEEILARHKIKYFLLYRNLHSYKVKNAPAEADA